MEIARETKTPIHKIKDFYAIIENRWDTGRFVAIIYDDKEEHVMYDLRENVQHLKDIPIKECKKCKKTETLQVCKKCRSVCYCSARCRKADYAQHNEQCKLVSSSK